MTNSTTGGSKSTGTAVATPYNIVLPAKITTKTSKTYTWTVKNTTTPPGTTTTGTLSYTFKLASTAKQSVTVPAGKFSAYLIDANVTSTISGKTVKQTVQEWVVPGTGIVKVQTVSGTTTLIVEFTKYKK